jgi:hypothetical protein
MSIPPVRPIQLPTQAASGTHSPGKKWLRIQQATHPFPCQGKHQWSFTFTLHGILSKQRDNFYERWFLVLQSSLGSCSKWSAYVSLPRFCMHVEFSPSESTETSFIYLFTLTLTEKEEYQTWSTISPTPSYVISAGSWYSYVFLTHSYM